MRRTQVRSAARTSTVDRYRRVVRARLSQVDWRADLGLALRVAVSSVLAAAGYAFSWVQVTSDPAVSRGDVAVGAACVLTSIGLFTAAMRLCRVRRPWLGGVYVAALTVLAGVWLTLFRGLESVSPTTWMGAAGCAAIIYAMGEGHPDKNSPHDHRTTDR